MNNKIIFLTILFAISLSVNKYIYLNSILLFLDITFHQKISSKYEIILEKFESALGDDDKMLTLGSLRVKKFNRTW